MGKADSKLTNPSDRQNFRQDMDEFEKRVDSQWLKPEQIKETYRQLEKLQSQGNFLFAVMVDLNNEAGILGTTTRKQLVEALLSRK